MYVFSGTPRRITTTSCRRWAHLFSASNGMATSATMTRAPKQEGSISSVFTTLTSENASVVPPRFADLKKEIWKDSLIQSWREVLEELEVAVDEISTRGSDMIPRVTYANLRNGLSEEQIENVKKTGTIIISGGVPKEEALSWKQSIREYATANSDLVRGFPPQNIQVFEMYNSKAQIRARTHTALIKTQKFMLSLWHTSDPSTEISLTTPISYFDRLRIRQPGDATFTLGPHIDGGSFERWEDPGYRACFGKILQGGSRWREHDPFDATPRIHAKQDLYNAPNQCSIFRPWQGWTSISSTGPKEGTLRVLPMLSLASAYTILRPFFRPRLGLQSDSLKFEDWEVDIHGPSFPGSGMGKAQELNIKTHPHLRLDRTMVSMPRVEPGDQVYCASWHCDLVHAVESEHRGHSDSSVLYIPAVPLTLHNASYLRDQRINFVSGLPAPDFPGGEGESKFIGRGTIEDMQNREGRQLLGFEPFDASPDTTFIEKANLILSR